MAGWWAEAEWLARQAHAGTLGLDDAAHRLCQFTEGGLTARGARDVLGNLDLARHGYDAAAQLARRLLRELDPDDPTGGPS